MTLDSIKKIYFIGIGGIGMSALARYFKSRGAEVHGYDKTETDLTAALAKQGMKIHYEDEPTKIPKDVDLVVWTPAVPADLKELAEVKKRGLPLKKRAEVLGIVSADKKCIAIGGTHGKTTTSSLAAHLMKSGGVDCSAFLGGISVNLDSNFVAGATDWVVAEADEYDRSFLQLTPQIAVISSLDADHLDIYGSAEAVVESYAQFARQIKKGGILIYKAGQPLPKPEGVKTYTFGFEVGDFNAHNWKVENGWSFFDLRTPMGTFKELKMRAPGKYNLENAAAAAACALLAGIRKDKLRAGLQTFKGVKRRFEFILKPAKKAVGEPVLIDDYAHHPAELEAVISAARSLYPNRKITGIFQPHLFSRTRDFADGFAAALSKLDTAILLPIYPAREKPIEGINSDWLLTKIKNVEKFSTTKEGLSNILNAKNVDIVLTLGAGDIDQLHKPIEKLMKAVS